MNDFCQWFQRKRSKNLKKLHKITNNSIKNRGSKLILNKSGMGSTKETSTPSLQQIRASVKEIIRNGLNEDRLFKESI